MEGMTMMMKDIPNESLFRTNGGLLWVKFGSRAHLVTQTGPLTYEAVGVDAPLLDYPVEVVGRLAGFRPKVKKAKKAKTVKKAADVSGASAPAPAPCVCSTKPKKAAKRPTAIDGAAEDLQAIAKQFRRLNSQLAKLRREMEQGPQPKRQRKAPAPALVEEEEVFF